jgi:hypothetical protein
LAPASAPLCREYEQKKQQDAFNDAMFDFMKDKNVISPEAVGRYHDMNRQQKNATILEAQFALKQRGDETEREWRNREAAAKANYYIKQGSPAAEAGANFTPRVITVRPPGGTPFNVWQRTPQQFERVYEPGEVQQDADTGLWFTVGPKGEKKWLDPVKVAQGKAFQSAAAPTPTPAPTDGGMWNPLNWFGTRSAPTPSPIPAIAQSQPANPVAQQSPITATTQEQAILQQARAAINRGAPRDAVMQRLQQVGVDGSGL